MEIHEQEIGQKVFGRSPEYDTNADNVVRVTASQVRKKLEQYFASDGASEPVILEIPKGQYTPVFFDRDAVQRADTPAIERPATAPSRSLAVPILARMRVFVRCLHHLVCGEMALRASSCPVRTGR